MLGKWYPPQLTAVELAFPFRAGTYAVMQGGSNGATNPFHHGKILSQQLAVDWVKLNGWGSRANGLRPDHLNDYMIYGDTLLAPHDGFVSAICDTLPDNQPGVVDTVHTRGNFIQLDMLDSLSMLMAHLQPNQIFVSVGDTVIRGEPLGLIGNSGNTLEPHLHLSLSTIHGLPVPMLVNGIYPVLNRQFTIR